MEYIKFDIVQFLKDARKWSAELEELNKRYEVLSEFNDLCILDGETVFVVKERIQLRINEIEKYKEALENAIFTLNLKEKECLTGFFFSDKTVESFVDKWVRDNHSNTKYCYQLRSKVLKKLGEYLLDYYTQK